MSGVNLNLGCDQAACCCVRKYQLAKGVVANTADEVDASTQTGQISGQVQGGAANDVAIIETIHQGFADDQNIWHGDDVTQVVVMSVASKTVAN